MHCPINGTQQCRCGKNAIPMVVPNSDFRITLRKLFTDHVVYTKMYIDLYLGEGIKEEYSSTANRLMENQKEIGDGIKPFGNGAELTRLLKLHIEGAVEALEDIKNDNARKLVNVTKPKIFQNSNQVADFLTSLNPSFLNRQVMREEFKKHNEFVLELGVLKSERNGKQMIKTTDAYFNHMMMFSDTLYYALQDLQNGK